MRCQFQISVVALFALISCATASAAVGLPSTTSISIPAGTLIYNGGGATLDNFICQDLYANTTADWTVAAIVIELTSGSIYQDALGNATGPALPAIINLAPSLAYDTYLTNPTSVTSVQGAAGDLGDMVAKYDDTAGLSVSWDGGGVDKSNIGATWIGRFTFSDDAQGSWSLAITEAFGPSAKFLSNPIINGQMIVDPLQGDMNFDGFVGIEDINAVLGHWNQNVAPGDRTWGDSSGDGFVGIEDLSDSLGNWNAGSPSSPTVPVVWPSGLTGDRDGDGFVGITDKVNFNWNQFVTPGSLGEGDTSGDGFVGLDDQNILLSNWNNGTPPPIAEATVPEPTSASLLVALCMVTLRRRA